MANIPITRAVIDPNNAKKIVLILGDTLSETDAANVAYVKGTVKSADGVSLESFPAQSVTNKVSKSDYQTWGGFAASPVQSSIYPYQCIVHLNDDHKDYLLCSKYKLYDDYTDFHVTNIKREMVVYMYEMGEWVIYSSLAERQKFTTFKEANNDVYTDQNYTTIRFSKST